MLYKNKKIGFTLVELLIVMSLIGVLATVTVTGFRTAQIRGRDAQRKSDLKQIGDALELYFADHNQYPDSISGQIAGCPSISKRACSWSSNQEFTDGNTTYFQVLPSDPNEDLSYYYRVPDSAHQKFQLYARLENDQDKNCLENNCENPTVPSGVTCGNGAACNFALTSPNATFKE